MTRNVCQVSECDEFAYGGGFCKLHWDHYKKHGDPLVSGLANGAALAYFWAHVTAETDDCIIWPYSKTPAGYGSIWNAGAVTYTHVMACEYRHGPRPVSDQRIEVGHGPCHNRACFNPRHLSWKTARENNLDRLRDGTMIRGEHTYNAVLTADQVREMRLRHARTDVSYSALARELGVSVATISTAIRRKTWAWLD